VRVCVLGSGSKGNCLVISGGGVVVMVDTGFSPRETRARLRHLDLDLTDISAILVTHAHGDHVKSVKQLAGSLGIKTWATEATKRFASTFTSFANHAVVKPGERFSIGGLSVLPVKTCHDEPGSVAYAITDGDEAFAICTDLGDPSEAVGAGLRDVDTLMLEFNHDRAMLQNGPYHARLKRRVASKYGHLNNDDAATLLRHAVTPNLSRLLCAHLSEVNNTPTKALTAARTVVDGMDVDVAVAPQHSPTNWLRVRRRGPAGEVVDVKRVLEARVVVEKPAAPAPAPAPARTSSPAPEAPVAQPAASSAVMALREAVTRRQMALFGGPTVSTTQKITSSIVSSSGAKRPR
jgi:phosphoribosyl 1,2-cyclic phosphodiesterase